MPDYSFMLRTAQNHSAGAGLWSDPTIWSSGAVPADGESVVLHNAIAFDVSQSARLHSLISEDGGHFWALADRDTNLLVQHLRVAPSAKFEIANVDPQFRFLLTFLDMPLDPADTEQIGNGAIIEGSCSLMGAYKTPFVRLAVPPAAGDLTLQLAEPVSGWRVGDRLLLPDTHQLDWRENHGNKQSYVPQWEFGTIQDVKDEWTILLSAPLKWTHYGAWGRTVDFVSEPGQPPKIIAGDLQLRFLPHVANLTRNVVVKSESARGTRGHVFATGRAEIDFRSVQFSSLGRTRCSIPTDPTSNHAGRHSIHLHNLLGPEREPGTIWNDHTGSWQWLISNCAISCGVPDHDIMGGVAVHTSHGYLGDNVLFNWRGWAIATSWGASNNVIERNFMPRVDGTGNRETPGRAGTGLWLRSPLNYVRGNVANNIYGGGYSYGYDIDIRDAGTQRVPSYPGADLENGAEGMDYVSCNMNAGPLLEFAGNECYGAGPGGLTIWRLGFDMNNVPVGFAGIIKDLRIWHCYDSAIYLYETNGLTIDGVTILGDPRSQTPLKHGFTFEDYQQRQLTVVRADVQAAQKGFQGPWYCDGLVWLDTCYFNCTTDIWVNVGWTVAGGYHVKPKQLALNNCVLAGIVQIQCAWPADLANCNIMQSNTITVYNHQTVQGDSFQVYWWQQHAQFVPPVVPNGVGTPEAGLTNKDLWDKHLACVNGVLAPDDATPLPGVQGLVARQ